MCPLVERVGFGTIVTLRVATVVHFGSKAEVLTLTAVCPLTTQDRKSQSAIGISAKCQQRTKPFVILATRPYDSRPRSAHELLRRGWAELMPNG